MPRFLYKRVRSRKRKPHDATEKHQRQVADSAAQRHPGSTRRRSGTGHPPFSTPRIFCDPLPACDFAAQGCNSRWKTRDSHRAMRDFARRLRDSRGKLRNSPAQSRDFAREMRNSVCQGRDSRKEARNSVSKSRNTAPELRVSARKLRNSATEIRVEGRKLAVFIHFHGKTPRKPQI